jgi:hypothetical protein
MFETSAIQALAATEHPGLRICALAAPQPVYSRSSSNATFADRGSNVLLSLVVGLFRYLHATCFHRLKKKNPSIEELDGRVVSAPGVRSRKLSTGLNGQS